METLVKLTAVFEKVPEGYVAFVEELPGANSQGKTIEEARENLREAVELILETNRQISEELVKSRDVMKEALQIP
jgi:predicted RNase H-like HicB family nuclease